jgi:hypothetical protein
MRVLLTILALVSLTGCQYNPYANQFTTAQPKPEDVTGTYALTEQTISPDGLSVLQGRQCQFDLRSDGTFSVTNYPTWSYAFSDGSGKFVAFVSGAGHWSCDTVGTVSDGSTSQSYWGVRFTDCNTNIDDALAFTGKAPPYGLIMTYGDPDSGTVMIFKKK